MTGEPMTATNPFVAELWAKGACHDGLAWAVANEVTSPADAWARLQQADWMLWVAEAFGFELDRELLRGFAYECADRAVRIHAVGALRSAGWTAEADRLAALAPITDKQTSDAAATAASAAAWAAWSAGAAAWDAWAAAAVSDAAEDAAGDSAADAERLLQADRLRALFPRVVES